MAGGDLGRRGSCSAAMLVLLGPMAVLLLMSNGCGVAAGEEYTVGGYAHWTIPGYTDFYADWAAQHQFAVGDTLVFFYSTGLHDVLPLPSEESFESCNVTAAVRPPFHGPVNMITLYTPGTKWYICSVPGHCSLGMKFKIDVSTTAGPSAAPPMGDAVNNTAPLLSPA